MAMYSDAHLHVLHEKWQDQELLKALAEARSMGLAYFVGAGYSPVDWQNQLALQVKQKDFFPVMGMHPMWIHSEHTNLDFLDSALTELSQLALRAIAIGETGLDLREAYKSSFEIQVDYFREHIELAGFLNKPLVLHLVRAHEEALNIFRFIELPARKGMVHAFNGSFQQMQDFIELGFYISVGGAVTFPRNSNLREAITKMDLSRLLIESDSPDQPPLNWESKVNRSSSVFRVAQAIGSLRQMKEEEVLALATNNLQRLFPELCQNS